MKWNIHIMGVVCANVVKQIRMNQKKLSIHHPTTSPNHTTFPRVKKKEKIDNTISSE